MSRIVKVSEIVDCFQKAEKAFELGLDSTGYDLYELANECITEENRPFVAIALKVAGLKIDVLSSNF